MPKTVFGNGTTVPPAWFNSQQNLLFDGLDLDGHQPLLTDSALSNVPGNIKADWALFRNAFSVMGGSGLAINIVGGIFTNSLNLPITVASAGISVAASSSVYVWINDTGAIVSGLFLPVLTFPIALVVTSPSAVTLITDLRPRFRFGPQTLSIAVFGGRSNTDVVYAVNSSVDGVINCRNFTVNAGVTLTVATGFLKIVASGTVTINGIINVTAPIGGGAFFAGGVSSPALLLSDSGKGFGGGSGVNGGGGKAYPFEASPFGSGGASGIASIQATTSSLGGNALFTSSRGGNGGGALIVEAAGPISVAGAISCNGENATAGAITSVSISDAYVAGGGGGSGGAIALRSLTATIVTAAGVLSVRGGNGADARISNVAFLSVGGGGGGGGRVFLASPATNTTGATITLTGGTSGANAGTAGSGLNGSPGGGFGGAGGGSGGGVGAAGTIGQLTLQSFITV